MSIILASNQGVQKSDLVIIFFFNGKRDVLIDTLECIVERVDCFSFNDAETIVNISYHFHTLGGTGVVLMAISLITSMHKLATTGLTGLPMAQPWIYL